MAGPCPKGIIFWEEMAMYRSLVISVCVAAGCVITPFVRADDEGGQYDFASDFSGKENPQGAWEVGTFNHKHTGKEDELMNLSTYGELKFTAITSKFESGGLHAIGTF